MLVLTQHACRLFTGPRLPVSGLFVSSNAHTCPHLLMPAHTCPLLCMCTPAHARSSLPSPVHAYTCPCLLTPHLPSPAQAHTCPCLLIPALTCACPYLPTPAYACSHHTCPHLSMDTPVKAPPRSYVIQDHFLFSSHTEVFVPPVSKAPAPSLSRLPAHYPRASFGHDSPVC